MGKTKVVASKAVKVKFRLLGQPPSTKAFAKGTKLSAVVEKFNLQGLELLVNGIKVSDMDYSFKNNDQLVALVRVKAQ